MSEGEKVAGDVLAEIGKSIEKIILAETEAGVPALGETVKTTVASEE